MRPRSPIFHGNVTADQGGFTISCAELNAYYKGEAGLADVTRTAEQSLPARRLQTGADADRSQEERGRHIERRANGSGDWAEFDAKTNMVMVGGDVVVTQGENMVRGTRLVIDMTSGESKIDTAPPKTAAQPAGGGWVTEAPEAGGAGAGTAGARARSFFPQQLKAEKPARGMPQRRLRRRPPPETPRRSTDGRRQDPLDQDRHRAD